VTIYGKLRFDVLKRDRFTCRYCGAKAPQVVLHVDHVFPRALGGSNEPGNLVTACADCNWGKAAVPLDARLIRLRRPSDDVFSPDRVIAWGQWWYRIHAEWEKLVGVQEHAF